LAIQWLQSVARAIGESPRARRSSRTPSVSDVHEHELPQSHCHCLAAVAKMHFASASSNFDRLVLGCIDASDSESRRIFQRFSSSTRLSLFRTAPKPKFQQKLAKILQKFGKISKNFKKYEKFSEISQNLRLFFAEICKICLREDDFRVDLEKR